MTNTIKWLWLSTMRGMTPFKISCLMKRYGSIEEIYKQSRYYDVEHINNTDKMQLMNKDLTAAQKVYKDVCDCGAYIMTCDNPHYPKTLKNIEPMPYVLYMKGNPMNLDNILGIGVVGTRNNTDYGAMCASKISYRLGKLGATVISGMALGIDCIAMHAAVKAGAKTIGVLGTGIDIAHPSQNRWLFDEVEKTGLIISEYPPGTHGNKGTFPQRNRIIAGLSKGVLVIEGSSKSGSLITAGFAIEYNRDVFAIPRSIGVKNRQGKLMDGTNALIQEGAKLVTCAEDILSEYQHLMRFVIADKDDYIPEYRDIAPKNIKSKPKETKPKETKQEVEPEKKTDVSSIFCKASNETEKNVINLLNGKELYPDEITQLLDENIGGLGVTLTLMETKGIIKKLPDGRYVLNI